MKRVLIIEDEHRIRVIYAALLRTCGVEVIEASNAWEAASCVGEQLDLVLLDLNLPHIDGRDFLEVIREYNSHIKVMIFSVYPVDKQQEMAPQAIDYFDKSQGFNILLKKIQWHLSLI